MLPPALQMLPMDIYRDFQTLLLRQAVKSKKDLQLLEGYITQVVTTIEKVDRSLPCTHVTFSEYGKCFSNAGHSRQ